VKSGSDRTRPRAAAGGWGTAALWAFAVALGMAPMLTTAAAAPGRRDRSSSTTSARSDGSGAYATRKYRNLFVEAGHTEHEVDGKIAKAYEQLFRGDKETERLYFPSGENENGPLAYIPDIQHNDVRSEGMSYGMMITVQLDKKAEFDALWNWSMTHMYQKDPRHPSYGFFSWQMAYDGTVMDELPAPDGEEYYVMALYFAANRWGNGKGIYDYKAHADRLLHDMVHREPITGMVRQRGGLREHAVGKEVNDEHGMILFSPDERNQMTDASYHLPAFYELWARWGPKEDRARWARAATVSRDYFVKNTHPKTGLAPNLGQFDGTPLGFRGPQSAAFREDAWRVAMNWSVDWSWWARDPRQPELSDRIQAFFEGQGMETYGDNWTLEGTLLRDRHSPGLVATNGVASLAATDEARAKRFTEALWTLDVPSSHVFRYYDGLLYLMSLMHVSGRFQIIQPRR
jgi:oligosaccharide reducing-end xylanase